MWSEDLTPYFNEFASTATWTHGGTPTTISGIFMRSYVVIEGVESKKPVFVVPAADVVGIAAGDTLSIDGDGYTIRATDHTSDEAILRLVLELTSPGA